MKYKIDILYEDEDILAIAKPAGVVVNRADSVKSHTIQDWMELHYQKLFTLHPTSPEESTFLARSGVAHRLDKDTSGILLVGKNPQSLQQLMGQFKHRLVKKKYVCLVHGIPNPRHGDIQAPISRSKFNRQQFEVNIEGKAAVTLYEVIKRYQHQQLQSAYADGFSQVLCFPKTGRTHQIRVHLKLIGHPLVGDTLYGSRKRILLDSTWCPRHFLHAQTIQFVQPKSGQNIKLECTLPNDLRETLRVLEELPR